MVFLIVFLSALFLQYRQANPATSYATRGVNHKFSWTCQIQLWPHEITVIWSIYRGLPAFKARINWIPKSQEEFPRISRTVSGSRKLQKNSPHSIHSQIQNNQSIPQTMRGNWKPIKIKINSKVYNPLAFFGSSPRNEKNELSWFWCDFGDQTNGRALSNNTPHRLRLWLPVISSPAH